MPGRPKAAPKKKKRRTGKKRSSKALATAILEVTVTSGNFATARYDIPLTTILAQRGGSGTFVTEIMQVDVSVATTTASATPIIIGIGGTNYDDSDVLIPEFLRDKTFFFTENLGTNQNSSIDTTDDNGNGVLYPGQSFWVNVIGATSGVPVLVKVLYRIKNVAQGDLIALLTQYFVNTNV